ncbi:membrane protein insertase YidC [Pseudomonas saudiphocaensis]|uniref:Membrane protein insertase YidC n=1 Tax=Pseudomonas saudiphocaensis TaxID=1499686 RepID=A0A078LVM9_9PSED|nr:membrane protein insertase YidC [Pseudomonas saudiphocaensis]RRV16551.1 membrane protein insertase YidC [Pseudomonas saudiphocaensis]CDZ95259.1 putative inner membrane protein translocase component YidC [Pseudomonas saudiphocaensis]
MDIKRSILLVSLAIVAYLLVLKWNQDYGQTALPDEPRQTQNSTAAQSDMPTIANPEGAEGDIPVVAGEQQANALPDAPASSQLIHVRTDVLDLAIDPRGGDIIDLKLPQYPRRQDRPDIPFQLFERSAQHIYEAQSGLIGDGPDKASGRPLYRSTQQQYVMAEGQDRLVVDLAYSEDGVDYIKRFSFERGAYNLEVRYLINNQSEKPWTGYMFGQLKRDSSGDPSSSTATGTATYLGAALWTKDEPYRKVSMGDMDDKNVRETVEGGWIAWLQHYFVTAWIPSPDQTNQVQTRKDSQGNYIIGYTGSAVSVAPGSTGEVAATLYAGPKDQDRLEELSPGLRLTVDYGFLWFIAQPIFWLLSLIQSVIINWGWSIIVLTVIIKLIFFPLSAASYRSMARMRAVAPKMQALKEQHGDDRQKMSQAMMELYKKEKINPLGGCLPILVQMPVFLALYWVLLESVEMRQAPWMFWITDLSIKDPYFILPIIMGVTMFFQQQLNPTPPDPMQARVMKLLPIIFTFFFLWFPAGLVLYWVVNNVLSIAQQWYITRKIEKATKAV